ncbi:MAG: amidohydrolase [Bacteroidetes bacterium]|nr:MAG: amidohydrolase [Bacteroidota bacterium]
MDLKQRIQDMAATLHPEVVGWRRHLHSHPELSFEERETAAYVQAQLEALGLEVQTGIGGHGLVALLRGTAGPSDRVLALRADMDALPITEANEVPYCSQNPGVMHACGHDAHTASLLGTVRILSDLRDQFAGTVKFLFQPAEERLPGGASLMIQDGALQAPEVEAILGQHVQPYLDAGKIGVRSGMYMASADEIHLRVIGKGGHAAHPAHFIDPVMITAQMLVSLQQVISRSDPRIPAILSFGRVEALGATNIIPEEVKVAGTLRCLDETKRHAALEQIRRIVHQVAEMYGGRAELDLKLGYPVLHNDEALTARSRARIADYVGEENVVDLDIWMAAEDFAWYTQEIPGCFYRLGTRNEARGIIHGLHTPRFDIDEDALALSTGLMAWLAIQELQGA